MKNIKIFLSIFAYLFLFTGCNLGTLELDDTTSRPRPGTVPNTVDGLTLPEKLQWLNENAVNGGEYTIELSSHGNMEPQTLSFSDKNIKIRLKSNNRERIIQLTDNGSLFSIGAGVTLILDSNITIRGHSKNNVPLIIINSRGSLTMKNGAKISGNTDTRYNGGIGGVYVGVDGSFFMEGGEIFANSASSVGGVYVADGGYFEMKSGKIFGNTANSEGGGVGINGRFLMTDGEISGNTARSGGGINMWNGMFEMEGGKILGNIANGTSTASGGGGIYVQNGKFAMTGGEISGNTARSGGGVFVSDKANFTKIGGVVYGYDITNGNGNKATEGINSNNKGHAVFINTSPNRRRETTAGAGIFLNSSIAGAAGGWE
ncbi:MAG: hypothetical protein LBH98_09130 [Chitinispirillales bacterium]|jgi:hypothetical protein|nr:hypothetical protein [Chitinispirillales bacterium]